MAFREAAMSTAGRAH